MPSFIIEEHEDGRYTIFVPSIPTPFAGAVFIADRERVHPLDVPFTEALRTVSKWGSGSKDLVAAMASEGKPRVGAAAREFLANQFLTSCWVTTSLKHSTLSFSPT